MLLRDAPWRDRSPLAPSVVWWQAFALYVNVIVIAHYRLRYTEARLRPATRVVLWDVLRAAKGVAVAWERWLLASHMRPPDFNPAASFAMPPVVPSSSSAEIASTPSAGTHTE